MSAEHATPHQPGDVDFEPHSGVAHREDDGHDDNSHEAESLGPVDVYAWGAFLLGTGLGLAVALCIAVASGALLG